MTERFEVPTELVPLFTSTTGVFEGRPDIEMDTNAYQVRCGDDVAGMAIKLAVENGDIDPNRRGKTLGEVFGGIPLPVIIDTLNKEVEATGKYIDPYSP